VFVEQGLSEGVMCVLKYVKVGVMVYWHPVCGYPVVILLASYVEFT